MHVQNINQEALKEDGELCEVSLQPKDYLYREPSLDFCRRLQLLKTHFDSITGLSHVGLLWAPAAV
jgi:hypothetical protein